MSRPPFFSDTRRLLLWLLVLGLLGLAGVGAVSLHRWVRKLPVAGLETAAWTAWNSGDPVNAGLAARRILEVDLDNLSATKLMAEMASQMKSGDAAAWWKRLVELAPSERAHHERLVLALIGRGALDEAEKTIGEAEAKFPQHVAWLRLRCLLAASRGDLNLAAKLFREIKGEKGDTTLRLALHTLEAGTPDEATLLRGREGLTELALGTDATALAAASSLLKLSVQANNKSDQARWSRRLLDDPACPPDEKLDALDKLAASGQNWKPDLEKIRLEALKTARGTHRLLGWLNARRELPEARLLLDSAPKDWLAQPPASLSAGETYLLQADWPALKLFLDSSRWSPQDPFRRLLELRWRKQQSNLEGGGTYETEAMTYSREIAPMPDVLEKALALVRSWEWDDLRILLLTERAKRWPQTEVVSLRELFGLHRKSGDIRGQFSVMVRVLEINPKDPVAMNNVAYLRMVLDEDVEKAHDLAAKVVEENPKAFAFHPTLVVSLVLKKRVSEALELFHEIPPELMKTYEVRFAHAMTLAAAGRQKEGQDKLAGMVKEDFSKEEWLLLERFGLRKP